MQQRLLALGGTEQAAAAARDRLVGETDDRRPALRASLGHRERRGAPRTLVHLDANDLGDHVAGPPHDHRVPDVHVLAPDFVLVVQRGIRDGDAADEDRLQPRDRRDRARAPDLDIDAEHFGGHLLGRKLVRDRPARLARHEPQPVLQRERIDLVDDAVDFEGKIRAPRGDGLVEGREIGGAVRDDAVGVDRKAEAFERVLHARAGSPAALKAARFADAVGEECERALRRHRGIDLAHRARGSVARIDEEPRACRLLPGVELREVAPRHVDLAAHFEDRRAAPAPELARDRANRPHVGRDILAYLAIAARRRDGQHAVLVAQADRQAIELELGQVFQRRCRGIERQLAAHPRVELAAAPAMVSVSVRIDSIGMACRTGAKSVLAAPPTFCVGESGVTRSG